MPNIRINDLPPEVAPSAADVVPVDGATTRKTTLTALVDAGRPLASQAEAEAGVEATKSMTPLTTAQAISAQGATAFATFAQGAAADAALPAADVAGGAAGQVLSKASVADFDFVFTNAGAGDVLAVNNLSDLDNVATARTNLGVAIGSDVQAWDAGLDTLAANVLGNTGLELLADTTPLEARTTISAQESSANLDAWSALATSAKQDASANLTTLAASAADGRGYLDAATYVATRAALKALDTTKDTAVVLTEGVPAVNGRMGTFLWRTGDFSTQIAADTLEGIYIKADAIASTAGAWVRILDDAVKIGWFGPAADGVTDDRAVLQKAIDLAETTALDVLIGAATYLIDITAASINLKDSVKIKGLSASESILKFQSTNATGTKTCINIADDNTIERLQILIDPATVNGSESILVLAFGTKGNNFYANHIVIDGQVTAADVNFVMALNFSDNADPVNIVFENFEITAVQRGILKTNASTGTPENLRFSRGYIHDVSKGGLQFNGPNGSYTNVVVESCIFDTAFDGTEAILLGGASVKGLVVSGNIFRGVCQDAIHFEEATNDFTISNNAINTDSTRGIFLVENNVGGVAADPQRGSVIGNTIFNTANDSTGTGIDVNDVIGVTFIGNRCQGWATGILIAVGTNAFTVVGNVLTGNTAGLTDNSGAVTKSITGNVP